MNVSSPEAPVLFEQRATGNRLRIGIATLNAPGTLNGLSLQMARLLDAQLRQWAEDDGIALVVLQGTGEKAFCAGGDLHGLYRGMQAHRQRSGWEGDAFADPRGNPHAEAFFETEYRLDYRIHTFPKPVLCWGHGIVMGGGIGLMSGASHRVVSERSRLAFPEISVGLFPDVGGSWLLQRVPQRGGLFLALTGAALDASDAIYAGMADAFIPEARRSDVFQALATEAWQAGDIHAQLDALLARFAQAIAPGPLQRNAERIARFCAGESLDVVAANIAAADTSDDPWLRTAQAALAAGSPGSARLAYALQQQAAALSLADVFRLEYIVALHCAAHGDFAEGIRALLIDKDRNPRWQPATLSAATAAWANAFFTSPWPSDAHPLADLGR